MTSESILQVEDLHVVFPMPQGKVRAVSGVSFNVKPGEILGIVGESGCGKTCTGRAILRLIPPPGKIAGGRIIYHDEDLLEKSDQEMRELRGRRISMVFQDPAAALNPLFTIGQQLKSIMKRHNVAQEEGLHKRAKRLLSELGLPQPEELLDTYPHELSGGMKQRAMIAMALSTEPDLIIADEPTSALDVTIQSQILDLLRRLQKEHDVSIVLITHDLGVVAETCDRVAVFYLGRIVEEGTAQDVFHHTKHPYTRGLLAALPNPDPTTCRESLKVIPGTVPTSVEPIEGCAFATRCEQVEGVCQRRRASLVRLSDTHRVACHLYVGSDSTEHRGR